MRLYTFKPLTKRQKEAKRTPTCEFGKPDESIVNQIKLCRKPASYLVYWAEKDGLCKTPAYGCEECKLKVENKEV